MGYCEDCLKEDVCRYKPAATECKYHLEEMDITHEYCDNCDRWDE
jgi:hypothetical protein